MREREEKAMSFDDLVKELGLHDRKNHYNFEED
jgi:hypothetical protein